MDSEGLPPGKRQNYDEDSDEFEEALDDWFAWCEWYESKDWKRMGRFAASRLVHVAVASIALASALCLWWAFRGHYEAGVTMLLSIVFVGVVVIGSHLAGSVMVPKFGDSPRSHDSFVRYLFGATSLAATGVVVLCLMDLLTALALAGASPVAPAETPWFETPPVCGLALMLTAASVFILALAKAELRESNAEYLEEIGFLDGELPDDEEDARDIGDDDSELNTEG